MSDPAKVSEEFARDIARIQSIEAVPKILDAVCHITGMGFAAVARVTDTRWICCAARDDIEFGLVPGGELRIETTICQEVREHGGRIVINDVADSLQYYMHLAPVTHGFKSYISVPIFRTDGTFFGTLCAIDRKPALLTTQIVETFALFAELIGLQLEAIDRLEVSETNLANERITSEFREQFIAVLGHDLRNPLASIDAGARLLRRSALSASDLKILELMQSSVTRIAGMIDNVMDFARTRLGSGLTLIKKQTNLAPLLKHVLSEIQSSSPAAQFDANIAVAFPVLCDGGRVQQLFSNLVGNAVAYGDLSQPIKIDARTDLQHFELSISNAGTQISPETLPRLFAPFTRGGKEGGGGLGLGLYIASEIARAHGGHLTASSTPEATCFTFRMPLE